MIKRKSVVKLFISISLLLISTAVFATDISMGVHFDNFNDKNTFGGSIGIKEELTDKFAIHAVLENNKSGNYSAYCAGGYEGKIFNFLGGFLFDLRNSYFSPGFILDGSINLFKFILSPLLYYFTTIKRFL